MEAGGSQSGGGRREGETREGETGEGKGEEDWEAQSGPGPVLARFLDRISKRIRP